MRGLLVACALELVRGFTASQCEVQSSALSKHEAVTRLCESLASCVADNQATSAGASKLRASARTENVALQAEVALLSKEQAHLATEAGRGSLAEAENQKLLLSVDALEARVAAERRVAEQLEADRAAEARRLRTAQAAAAAAALNSTSASATVHRLGAEVATLAAQARSEDGVRTRLETELAKATSVAAHSVAGLHSAEAKGAHELEASESIRRMDADLVRRLAASENEASRLAKANEELIAKTKALEAAAEKTVAELRARADAAGRDRDGLRARLRAADAACAVKVRDLELAQQKELAQYSHLLHESRES
jgi:hypothetical protein